MRLLAATIMLANLAEGRDMPNPLLVAHVVLERNQTRPVGAGSIRRRPAAIDAGLNNVEDQEAARQKRLVSSPQQPAQRAAVVCTVELKAEHFAQRRDGAARRQFE